MKRSAVYAIMALVAMGCAPAAAPTGEPEPEPTPAGGGAAPEAPASPGAPQEPTAPAAGADAGTTTIWDGVYTLAQAREGEQVAQVQCTICHSPSTEWPLVLDSWSNRPILDMYDMIRNTMPQTNPGGLTREQYADIVAYILALSEVPPGTEELPSSEEGLSRIMATRR